MNGKSPKEVFLSHKDILVNLLDENFISITHVGGTSIPGAITKGDVDIQVRVTKDGIIQARELLRKKYLEKNPEIWNDTFCVFKYDDLLPVDIIVVVKDTEKDTHLKAQKLLMENPQLLSEYNKLKTELLNGDQVLYHKEKYDFFKRITC